MNRVGPDVVEVQLISCRIITTPLTSPLYALQVGAIRATSTRSILLKNISDATVSLVAWYMFGYGIAFGKDRGHVIGTNSFFFTGEAGRAPTR